MTCGTASQELARRVKAAREKYGFGLHEAKRYVATQQLAEEIDSLDALSTGDDIRKVLQSMLVWMVAR